MHGAREQHLFAPIGMDHTTMTTDKAGNAQLFEAMLRADILIVGSPVHFGSATPELMALLDRAGYVARANGNLLPSFRRSESGTG